MSDVHEVWVREEDLRSAMLAGDASAPSDLIVEHRITIAMHRNVSIWLVKLQSLSASGDCERSTASFTG